MTSSLEMLYLSLQNLMLQHLDAVKRELEVGYELISKG